MPDGKRAWHKWVTWALGMPIIVVWLIHRAYNQMVVGNSGWTIYYVLLSIIFVVIGFYIRLRK